MSTKEHETYEALIARLFGDSALTYLQNKHRGGVNGKKGTRYEDQFATFKIAELLAGHVQDKEALPEIEEQGFAFVDDLIIAASDSTKYYQCKNSGSVSWTSGDHPIADDFRCQMALAKALEKPEPSAALVVSDPDVAADLAAKTPADIEACASVEYFPYHPSVNQLVLEHEVLREKLTHLTRRVAPEFDELEAAFSALLLAWIKVVGGCPVREIIQSVRAQSPQLLRVFPLTEGNEFLQQQFVDVLAAIPGLQYSVKRGFFSWAAEGVSVTLDRDCASEEFARFQQRVIQAKPKNFDDFWDLLP